MARQEVELGVFFDHVVLCTVTGYSAGTYGIQDEATLDAIRTCARLEGVLTDAVYEEKTMAGLISMTTSGEIHRGITRTRRPHRRPALPARLCGRARVAGHAAVGLRCRPGS